MSRAAVWVLLLGMAWGSQASEVKELLDGNWMFTVKSDPMDDSAVSAATKLEKGALEKNRDPVSLTIRCRDGILDLYINWDDYLGTSTFVEMRVGQGKAERTRWNMSNDDTASFYPASVPFLLEKLVGEETLAVRTVPYRSSPITAVFELGNLEAVIDKMEPYCAMDSSQAFKSGRGSIQGSDVNEALSGLTLFSDGNRVTVEAISGETKGPFRRGDLLDTIDDVVINDLADLAEVADEAEFQKIFVERNGYRKRIRIRR